VDQHDASPACSEEKMPVVGAQSELLWFAALRKYVHNANGR
jgi:hypothetical protein